MFINYWSYNKKKYLKFTDFIKSCKMSINRKIDKDFRQFFWSCFIKFLPGLWAWDFELLKNGSFKFPPPRAKMVFKCPSPRRICPSYPTKQQSSSAPPVFNKDLLKTYISSFKTLSSRPKTCFIAVSDFGARKKNYLKPDTSGSISPPHGGTEDIQMPGFCPDRMLKFWFDRRIRWFKQTS